MRNLPNSLSIRLLKSITSGVICLLVIGLPFITILAYPPAAGASELTDELSQAVVRLQAHVPEDARTARNLGTLREGNGILIDKDGLILTIGYLIMESTQILVSGPEGHAVPADFVAYDHTSGFGLVRASQPFSAPPLPLGSSTDIDIGAPALVVSSHPYTPVTPARIVSKREFAGYWEYLLPGAIFTMPPHPHFGGAALVDTQGKLIGVGSLIVPDAFEAGTNDSPGNMFVPIDVLKPILDSLIKTGKSQQPAPPWLGLYPVKGSGRVFITRVADNGPAKTAGLKTGDIVIGVNEKRISDVADLYRKIRTSGAAGTTITLNIIPANASNLDIRKIKIKSIDRHDWLK